LCLACLLNGSCAFHKTADRWNGLVGPAGQPVYLNATTKVGFHFLVFLPFLGRTGLDGMVEEATQQIRNEGGDFVRVVQSDSQNYWYALPPVTWVITPVVNSLVVEYRPRPRPVWPHRPGGLPPPPEFRPVQNYSQRGVGS
jgi:hypothetical protein